MLLAFEKHCRRKYPSINLISDGFLMFIDTQIHCKFVLHYVANECGRFSLCSKAMFIDPKHGNLVCLHVDK